MSVVIRNMEKPKSCSSCKFHKLMLPDTQNTLPSIVCMITGRVVFGEEQDSKSDFFTEVDEKCELEDIMSEKKIESTADMEVINIWMDRFRAGSATIDEAMGEAQTDLENERIWLKRSITEEEIYVHSQAIANLELFIKLLEDYNK